MITPCGMYMNPSRTGGLYDLPSVVSARPLISKKSRASAAPIPCRQVRRPIRALLIIGSTLFRVFFRDPTIREGVTGHNGRDKRLHAVAICGDFPHQIVHHDLIVTFQPSA